MKVTSGGGIPLFRLECRECGCMFNSKGHNARFCHECARRRKRAQDHAAWIKRKNQEEALRIKAGGESIPQLERRHARELGITTSYYNIFKSTNRNAYHAWLKEEMNISK